LGRFHFRRRYAHPLLALLLAIVANVPGSTFAQDPAQAQVRVVGSFTNMRFTDEHAYGYAVELWRHEKSLIGLFLASEGLQGDTPAGLLEKVTFDASTGALSFEARLTTGVVYSKEHGGVPSRDRFRFTGVLTRNQLRGRLERLDGLADKPVSQAEQVLLHREKPSSNMLAYPGYADWKQSMGEILKFRGPKW
jgi:hypothetical protein